VATWVLTKVVFVIRLIKSKMIFNTNKGADMDASNKVAIAMDFYLETLPRWIGNIFFVVVIGPFIIAGFVCQKIISHISAGFMVGWSAAKDFK
jgi:hypothetical protein